MAYAISHGLRIHYEVEGDGPPLVLQHGFTQWSEHWRLAGYVDALKSDYRLILVDARGHGASDKPYDGAAYGLEKRVGDVIAVLDDLGVREAHFWGYSMGGAIGFGMAKHAPQRPRALVIGGADPYERRAPDSADFDAADPQAFVASFLARIQVVPASLTPERRALLFANDFKALAAAYLNDGPSLEDALPTMAIPCLVYASDKDPCYAKAWTAAQQIPKATFVSLSKLDHDAAFRESGQVLPHVMEFPRRLSPT